MSDLATQNSAANLLAHFRSLTVDARTCERGAFLIVECSDTEDALKVDEMVMMTDSHAELTYSKRSPSEAQTVRTRMAPDGGLGLLYDGDLLDA